jgi:NhaA family Na+:H+ antiporter
MIYLSYRQLEILGGTCMFVGIVAALFWANMYPESYKHIINSPFQVTFADKGYEASLKVAVKDILMVFFFALIAMELKLEACEGVLTSAKKAAVPFCAAVGGMFVPAFVYLLCVWNHPEYYRGFAISSATDIAFAIALFNIVFKNFPPAARIFLLAVAIFDDLGAILIIATVYNEQIQALPLFISIVTVGGLYMLNRRGVVSLLPYLLCGGFLWVFFYLSGIHTTLAGVIVGISLPYAKGMPGIYLKDRLHKLSPFVQLVVLPLFALTASGIYFGGFAEKGVWGALAHPVAYGIIFALVIGKPLGIFSGVLAAKSLRLGIFSEHITYYHLLTISFLAGIGFTMSLFIALLAFKEPYIQNVSMFGVVVGSSLSIICALFLRLKKLPLPH